MSKRDQAFEEEEEELGAEMSFLEHLEELRWRLVYISVGIFVGAIIAWIFKDFIVEDLLLAPATAAKITLQNLKPFGQLFLYVQVALIIGFIISIPNFFYHLWRFISPALKENEKKYIAWIVFISSFCFLVGVMFAYKIMLPLTLEFAGQFGTEQIENNFAIDEYFSIIISVMLAAGVVFELPVLSFFLSKIGILSPKFMRKYQRHAIVIIMILSALLTPGTDPVAQMLLAIPLVILYEISILVSKIARKKS